MILVCGGLADTVTELVCARLEHSGYPYRLLDLAHYPDGFTVAWRWSESGLAGTIAGPDWVLDLDEITGVADLPAGWTEEQEAATYRLARRDDEAVFGFASTPHAWKRWPGGRILRVRNSSIVSGFSNWIGSPTVLRAVVRKSCFSRVNSACSNT